MPEELHAVHNVGRYRGLQAVNVAACNSIDRQFVLVSDLGGAGQLSEACLQLCRRLAGHSCLAEAMEAKVVNGETIDLQEYALMTSNSVRVASRIGIERIARDISPPTLDQIAEEIEAEREANE